MTHPNLSIIIPAYNEAERIGATLAALSEYFLKYPTTYEVIVVDDGSKDATSTVVGAFSGVCLLQNETNKGKGYSVKRGMLEAKGERRLFMDADSSVSIENLERFMKEMDAGADIVIGSIELPGSTIEDDNYGYRRVFGRWAKGLIRAVATPGIYDTQRGFKLFTREAAETLFSGLKTERWGFDIEILSSAQKKRMKIKEIPVKWVNSRAGSVTLGSYFYTLYELIKIKICA